MGKSQRAFWREILVWQNALHEDKSNELPNQNSWISPFELTRFTGQGDETKTE